MKPPPVLGSIERETEELGFDMASVHATGALLRHLAASKPKSRVLEIGTGTGLATCWLLDGMDQSTTLVTVDIDPKVIEVAHRNLGDDHRLRIVCEDGTEFLRACSTTFDLIFADAWPGKFSHLGDALSLLADDGLYVVDDLLPQDSWPEGHAPRVPKFIEEIRSRPDLEVEYREWASGILIAQKHIRSRQ